MEQRVGVHVLLLHGQQAVELRLCCQIRRWLLGLLVLQSTSSFVLEQYQELLKQHLVVTVFLTMLVGAGGNAGNQSAIKVIRGLVCTLDTCTLITMMWLHTASCICACPFPAVQTYSK